MKFRSQGVLSWLLVRLCPEIQTRGIVFRQRHKGTLSYNRLNRIACIMNDMWRQSKRSAKPLDGPEEP